MNLDKLISLLLTKEIMLQETFDRRKDKEEVFNVHFKDMIKKIDDEVDSKEEITIVLMVIKILHLAHLLI